MGTSTGNLEYVTCWRACSIRPTQKDSMKSLKEKALPTKRSMTLSSQERERIRKLCFATVRVLSSMNLNFDGKFGEEDFMPKRLPTLPLRERRRRDLKQLPSLYAGITLPCIALSKHSER